MSNRVLVDMNDAAPLNERIDEIYRSDLLGQLCAMFNRLFRTNARTVFQQKPDGSLFSLFERDLERDIGLFLHHQTPWANIVGEEGLKIPADNAASKFTWLIDPIDGTISYRNGLDTFSFVVTLVYAETPIASLVYFPSLERRYETFAGKGVLLNGVAISQQQPVCGPSAVFAVSDEETFESVHRTYLLDSLRSQRYRIRHYTDLYGHVMVSHGSCILKVDAACARWDRMPAQLLAQEAGLLFEFLPVKNPTPDLEGTLLSYHPVASPLAATLRELVLREAGCASD